MIRFLLVRVFQAILTLLVAIFAPVIAPHSAIDADLRARGMPPVVFEGGSWEHVLGTDRQGRDILSRILVGTRISLSVAALSILIGGVVGTSLGLLAGYRGGWVDALIMRSVDIMLAFPSILMALILAVTIGPSFWMVVVVLGFILWARYARLVRGEVLAWKERDFVALARMAGCSSLRILLKHLFPNVVNSVVVLSTLQVGWAIVVEASLSFLGVGIPPPTPTWGGMVAKAVGTLKRSGGSRCFPASPLCWWCCRSTCLVTGYAIFWTRSCGNCEPLCFTRA